MNKSTSTVVIKKIDAEQRRIWGVASTSLPDLQNDIVNPRGYELVDGKMPKLLVGHDSKSPAVGRVLSLSADDKGIYFEAEFFPTPPGEAAFANVKMGAQNDVSIGFSPIESEPIRTANGVFGTLFKRFRLLEISLVTLGASIGAQVLAWKSADRQALSQGTQMNYSIQKGANLVRYIRHLCVARGDFFMAQGEIAGIYGEGSEMAQIAKSAVDAATTGNSTYAGALTPFQMAGQDFIDWISPRTVIGKLANLRRVPSNTKVPATTANASAGWIGEGVGIKVSALAFETLSLPPRLLAALAVFSDEIARLAAPDADRIFRTDLAKAVVKASDETFVSTAGATSIAPAGIAHGAPSVAATNNRAHDFAALFDAFGGDLEEAYFAMSPSTAVSLSGADHPDIGARGGSLFGVPVVTSGAFTDDSGGARILLLDPTRIALSDDGLELGASTQGTVQQSDSPTQDASTGTGSQAVSLFQVGAVAVKCVRRLNWQLATGAVAQLTGVSW